MRRKSNSGSLSPSPWARPLPHLILGNGALMPLTDEERIRFRSPDRTIPIAVLQGELIEITYLPRNREYRRPGRRKPIAEFTPAARLRMLRMIAAVDWEQVKQAVFITLTYPDAYIERSMETRTRDKYLFFRHMENYLGKKVGAVWRLEWETRKSGAKIGTNACHVHAIVFGVRFIEKDIVRSWWRSVLSAEGPLMTWIDQVKGGRKVARYVAKYCGKRADVSVLDHASYLNRVGRHWGVRRKHLVPFCQRWVIPFLTPQDIQLAENFGCSVFRYFTREAGQGFSLLGKPAAKLGAELLERMIDKENRIG